MENMELLKAMKEMIDANQANADVSLKELKEDMKAIQDKMDGRQENVKAQVGSLASYRCQPRRDEIHLKCLPRDGCFDSKHEG
jgi:hypothetical protein